MARSFADLFRPFTSAYDEDDELEELDPIAALVKAKQKKAEATKQESARSELQRAMDGDADRRDVLTDDELGIEVRGQLDPELKVELRSLFSRYKRARAADAAEARAKLEAEVASASAEPELEIAPEDVAEAQEELERIIGESPDRDDEPPELPQERYPKSRAFEEELEARRRKAEEYRRERQQELDRRRGSDAPEARTRKRRRTIKR